jgi:metallo-beta-lactamase family protein
MNEKIKLKFCGGVGNVTGANFLLNIGDKKILIDCGLVQGSKVATEENYKPWIYEPSEIEALFVTHAHLDHVGRIPKLVKDGFMGKIYSTYETRELAQIVLEDAVTILTREAEESGIEPLYNQSDVSKIFSNWQTFNYHERLNYDQHISIYPKDAGHILGSTMYEFTIKGSDEERKILFTGDLGNSPSPLLRDTEEVGEVDYVVMESVYGDRNHEDRNGRDNHFQKIVNDAIARGGTLVIPTFSVDRTQVLLYLLNNLVEKNKIPKVPIFVDSPMAISATAIYSRSKHLFNEKIRKQIEEGDDIFKFPSLHFTMSGVESKAIENTPSPKIILAGSGMSIGGRVISHEKKYLPDPKNTILMVGYQSFGSLGRELQEGAKKVKIYREIVKVKAKIETIYGYSAHKDSDHLLQFVGTGQHLKKVFVVMGEPKSAMYLSQRINDNLNIEAIAPEFADEVNL